ncbi:MAG: toxin-antitoxin system HicB family antitoxin [Oleiphilaceae bacterium]|nr:toxin-antitoxin system HicB family antitoxin [Oleiphilaceae bacterium]
MSTLTIRLPDDKHNRLKALAEHRKISMNKLIEELSTQALAEFDTEVRFRAMAATGKTEKGLEILDKLDAHFGS